MQIDRRITNGLAWAGVVLVIGVPVADVVSAQMMGERAPTAQVATIAPTETAPVEAAAVRVAPQPATRPTATVAATPAPEVKTVAPVAVASAAETGDVVDGYLKSGKPLPSYITGANTAPVVSQPPAPATVATAPAVVAEPASLEPVDVASLATGRIAPVPMPLSMRPAPVVIVQDQPRNRTIQVAPGNAGSRATVSYGDLEDWEAGPLSEFLAKRQATGRTDPGYDPDGFFLDEGPNGAPRRDRLIGPADEFYFPFAN